MENMQYAEELLRDFLVFRGFTSTLQVFEKELSTDVGRNFQVDKILDLIFSVYIPTFQVDKLLSLLNFFRKCLPTTYDIEFVTTFTKLEVAILRYYIVSSLKSGRKDKVVEFIEANGNYLLQRREEWMPWFAIPYMKNPSTDPQFLVYFSKEWFDALYLSVQNFLSEIFSSLPALLKISMEKNTVKRLKDDIKQLNERLLQLQALLEIKEDEMNHLRSVNSLRRNTSLMQESNCSVDPSNKTEQNDYCSTSSNKIERDVRVSASQTDCKLGSDKKVLDSDSTSMSSVSLTHPSDELCQRDDENVEIAITSPAGTQREELPEVKVEFQETFLGHTNPITRCRFSASGANIASASVDGTVRIWTYDSSTPTSRNATIYCGNEIMSLDWECRSDRLLLIGTADGGIKAWNADAKRVVCDLSTAAGFPSVLDLKCSPVDPVFVSAAASTRNGMNKLDKLGFASLTVWNVKTWKAMTVLPLGEDPPAITSVCFNHNGKILAASATDGMIHIFDMLAGLQITGWPAHDAAVCSVRFGPDETSIFSLGSDGKILEWSLHNQGQVLWSRDSSRFCSPESMNSCRHEIALDSNGRRLLVTSGLVRSPIYQVQGHTSGLRTLPHSAPITTVDWHPTKPIFLTGSADHSVRVTSIG